MGTHNEVISFATVDELVRLGEEGGKQILKHRNAENMTPALAFGHGANRLRQLAGSSDRAFHALIVGTSYEELGPNELKMRSGHAFSVPRVAAYRLSG